MEAILNEFYARDESLRKLPYEDQARLFAVWASEKGISERLEIEQIPWVKHAKWCAALLVLAATIMISQTRHAFTLVPWMMLLPFVKLAVRGRKLVVTRPHLGNSH